MSKQITLKELEKMLGKEQLTRLFMEHYLSLVGSVFPEEPEE